MDLLEYGLPITIPFVLHYGSQGASFLIEPSTPTVLNPFVLHTTGTAPD